MPSFTNAYSVAFDGTDDYAQTDAVSTRASKTYSFWAKSSDTARNDVFWHGAGDIGFFGFNFSGGRSVWYLGTGYFRYWDSTDERADGNWHNWIVYIDSTISGSKLYLDGSEVDVNYTLSSGSAKAYTSGLRIGAGNYDGNIDEFAIFDGDKTSLASTLYNSGVPADLTGLSGLEHWWRMGDGPLDEGGLIGDQVNPTMGSELMTNGDFATGDLTGWTVVDGGQTVEEATNAAGDNALHVVTDGTYCTAYQVITSLASGSVAKLTYDFEKVSGNMAQVVNGVATTRSASGSYTVYFVADGSDTIEFKRSGAGEWYVSNVTVKKVNGSPALLKNGAAIEEDVPS